MTLSSKKAPPPPSTFLSKLSTLRDFVGGMGLNASEDDLSHALKGSGHNVELALERILAGNFGGSGIGGGGGSGFGGNAAASSARTGSTPSSSAIKKRGGSSSLSSSSSRTPKSGIKRQKFGGQDGRKINGRTSLDGSGTNVTSQQQTTNNRLLLCKRWTVACSKSTRGRVNYGETLDFTENWKNNAHHMGGTSHVTPKKGGKLGTSSNNQGKGRPLDPMVRFHSRSGNVEGTLNRYLCSVLSPLLHLPATNNGISDDNGEFVPMVSVEGTALMEDRSLVIGSDVPICLEVYVNDPIGFFDLFHHGGGEDGGENTSSKLFFQKKKGNGGKMPSYQGKKAKSSFSEGELAEAAFHLLQWAERGEEMPFSNDAGDDGGDGKSEGKAGESEEENEEEDEEENADGDYEEAPESEEVDELNRLVASQDEGGKPRKSLPELSDPKGFKGVVLRPYQRQALYWMCKREGCIIKGEMDGEDANQDDDGELDLLAELASATYSTNDADVSIQVVGGKAVSCDCGPVVVNDENMASRATPVIEYSRKKKSASERYVHHPLWKRRFLATDDLSCVYAYYVNELLGIASATPPTPPKQCSGGILADAMGLGKTVMLLALILKTKESDEALAEGKESSSSGKRVVDAPTKSDRVAKRKKALPDEDVVDLSFDIESDSDCHVADGNDDDDGDESWASEQEPPTKKRPSINRTKTKGTTLVVAPLSLISQWEEELATKTDLSHLVYYDAAKKATGGEAFSRCDVVVTTYGTIQSEFVSMTRSSKLNGGVMEPGHGQPLLKFGWKRIILDEAHGIKNPATVVSRACCALRAETRFVVTGTPIQNSLQDVYGLLKFLRHEPWCEATFWRNAITDSAPGAASGAGNASAMVNDDDEEKESPSQELASAALSRVRRVLAPIILRRTKDTLTEDGTPILTLPPVDSSIVHVTLSPPEREFYTALLERSQSVFDGYINAGTASKSWFAIFSLLQRLRQACDHVSLTVNKKIEAAEEVAGLKNAGELVRVDSSENNDGGEGAIDDDFLSNLLSKFKRNTDSSANEDSAFATQVAESLTQCVESNEERMSNECPICLDEPRIEDAVHTPCAHMFCRDCLLGEFHEQIIRSKKKAGNSDTTLSNSLKVEGGSCPVCHDWVKNSSIIQIQKSSESGEMVSTFLIQSPQSEKENSPNAEVQQRDTLARETLESALNGASSSKLEAVLAELDKVWTQDPGSKVLIFSQYLGFLDIIGSAVNKLGVECFRIDGKLSLKERVAMISKFNKSKPAEQEEPIEDGLCQRGSVFLVSMKAGGVGLNLVAASTCFILDPWWNAAIEDQCINRIHRIGQQAKVVRVRKFVVTDSVEEKIVTLQGKKKGMATEILDSDGGGQLDSTKPTLEDFKLLFGR